MASSWQGGDRWATPAADRGREGALSLRDVPGRVRGRAAPRDGLDDRGLVRPGLHDEYVTTTGAILGGRNGWDQAIDGSRPYGGAWQGPIFVLTHHPEDATPADGVTFLTCGPAEAVRIGLAAAGGKNLEVFSPTIGRQLLELGLIDEIDLHILPVLLGEGIRLYDNPAARRSASGRRRRRPFGPQCPVPAGHVMDGQRIIDVNGVDLCVDTTGDAADPAILLIGGMGASMDWWEEEFCQRLAAGGRFVIRYDHRDTGRSVSYPAGAPGYTGADLAADVIGVLDALGRRSAHLAGISMGGALAQQVALAHPDRVDSLVLFSTSPAVPGGPGRRSFRRCRRTCGPTSPLRSHAGLGRTGGGDRLHRRLRAAPGGGGILRRSSRARARGTDRRPHHRRGGQHDEPRAGRGG